MKRIRFRLLCMMLVVVVALSPAGPVMADQSLPPDANSIEVNNNSAGTPDTITVTGLEENDKISIYTAATGGTAIATATVESGAAEAVASYEQLGVDAGSIFVTITKAGDEESDRTEKTYIAEAATKAPKASDITIINNNGIPDTITVTGLAAGDIIRIYTAATGGTAIKTATAAAGEATVTITQLGNNAGTVYVTVTTAGKTESARTAKAYDAVAVSAAPIADKISVVNKKGIDSIITVTGLAVGDVVKAYLATSGLQLGLATITTAGKDAVITTQKLVEGGGQIKVTVTNLGKLESAITLKDYDAVAKSGILTDDNIITIVNNYGKSDTINVTGLSAGDVIRVYKDNTVATVSGSAAVATGKTDATSTISQLSSEAGTIYISVTYLGKLESNRLGVAYKAEQVTEALDAAQISVKNNATLKDTVTVIDLKAGDIIKVYEDNVKTNTAVIGSAAVAAGNTSAVANITQLGTDAGQVYVSVTSTGMLESDRTDKTYDAEQITDDPIESNIKITNNVILPDTIVVKALEPGDSVKIYKDMVETTPIGSAVVAKDKTEASISIKQLGVSLGSVCVSITKVGKLESDRIEIGFEGEKKTDPIADTSKITIVNNTGKADTINVTGLLAGDIVTVYQDDTVTTALGKATVAASKSEATVNVTQLSSSPLYVYVTITRAGKYESDRVKKDYAAELKSDKLTQANADKIIITNNAMGADTILVPYLNPGDIVKVYEAEADEAAIATATVPNAKTAATVTTTKLSSEGGTVYITITNTNPVRKLESDKVAVVYGGASQTDEIEDTNTIIITNSAGLADTVQVTGLEKGDLVKVYRDATVKGMLGSATAKAVGTPAKYEATIPITQLGTAAGTVYVTVTRLLSLESPRVAKNYAAEKATDPIASSKISIANKAAMPDTITVTGLKDGDLVKIYKDDITTTVLGKATAKAIDGTPVTYEAVVSIAQIGTGKVDLYVSVTAKGSAESTRTLVTSEAEEASTAPDTDYVLAINNTGMDVIVAYELTAGDTVKIYNNETKSTLLAKASVAAGQTYAVIPIKQLGTAAGKVYMSVTSVSKTESPLTEVPFGVQK